MGRLVKVPTDGDVDFDLDELYPGHQKELAAFVQSVLEARQDASSTKERLADSAAMMEVEEIANEQCKPAGQDDGNAAVDEVVDTIYAMGEADFGWN